MLKAPSIGWTTCHVSLGIFHRTFGTPTISQPVALNVNISALEIWAHNFTHKRVSRTLPRVPSSAVDLKAWKNGPVGEHWTWYEICWDPIPNFKLGTARSITFNRPNRSSSLLILVHNSLESIPMRVFLPRLVIKSSWEKTEQAHPSQEVLRTYLTWHYAKQHSEVKCKQHHGDSQELEPFWLDARMLSRFLSLLQILDSQHDSDWLDVESVWGAIGSVLCKTNIHDSVSSSLADWLLCESVSKEVFKCKCQVQVPNAKCQVPSAKLPKVESKASLLKICQNDHCNCHFVIFNTAPKTTSG